MLDIKILRALAFLLCLTVALGGVGCADTTGAASSTDSISSSVSGASEVESEEVPVSSEEPADPYAHRVLNLTENRGKWRITGRTNQIVTVDGDPGMVFDNPAQGLLFNADCEGDLTVNISLKIPTGGGYQHFLVRVDGEGRDVRVSGTTAEMICKIPVAAGLAKGEHKFEIYRCNQVKSGTGAMVSVELNGTLLPYEAPKRDLKMVFLGDSITSGVGAGTTNGAADQNDNSADDATLTYAFVCGELLGADFYQCAFGGVNCSADLSDSSSVYHHYDYVSYWRTPRTKYDNTQETDVDVYVISLGTNDVDAGHTAEVIRQDVQNLIRRVRADHPNAKIVWTYGQLHKAKLSAIRSAVEDLAPEVGNLWFYAYARNDQTGGNWHPSAAAHARDGQELADFIRDTVLK